MRVIGLLNWFDESPSWLATAVAGHARICDTIIAVDGAYHLYPNARPASHPRQAEAIMHTAEAGGAACIIYRPTSIWWGNELAKRNQLIRLAGSLELTTDDWLLIFDADNHILTIDPEMCRAMMEASDLNVATYTVLDGKDFLADETVKEWVAGIDIPDQVALAEYVRDRHTDCEWTFKDRNIFRWNPTLRVGPQHWQYSAIGESGKREWVRGPNWDRDVPALQLGRYMVSYHRPEDRPKSRRDLQAQYYRMREEYRVEFITSHDPPVFEDETSASSSEGAVAPAAA